MINEGEGLMKIGVLLVHGIGGQTKDWANDIITDLNTRTFSILKNVLGEDGPSNCEEILIVKSVHWQDVLHESQHKLREILEILGDKSKKNLIGKIGRWLRKKVRLFQSRIISEYIGDIIGYLNEDTKRLIQGKVTNGIEELLNEMKVCNGKTPITIVSHSLGTVISSDYIYDLRNKDVVPKEIQEKVNIDNFFTIGSPIALFALKHGDVNSFNTPINVENKRGRWINIYDEDDPVGMPLKSLNEEYKKAVLKDVHVNAGFYGVSHTKYFLQAETLDIVCNKLTLDWIIYNKKLNKEKIDNFIKKYDNTLRLL